MDKIKIAFFDSKPYDIEFFNEANLAFGYEIKFLKTRLNKDTVMLTKGYDAICPFVNDDVSAEIIGQLVANGIKLIALRSAGYNNVNLKAAYQKINVVRVPAYSPHAVAEHAVALMLSLNRHIHRAYYRVRDLNFSIDGLVGFDMAGKTVGIIGTGKIGLVAAKILKGFEMEVIAHDPYPNQKQARALGFAYVPLNELYSRSDIISLHCPLTPETKDIINKKSLAIMKDGAMLINTGRGKLIKTEDLIEALISKKIGSAGLDVYEEESEYFFEDFSGSFISDEILARLLALNNVLITSHQGFFTREALRSIALTTLNNIKEYFADGALTNEVCYQCEEKGTRCIKERDGKCF